MAAAKQLIEDLVEEIEACVGTPVGPQRFAKRVEALEKDAFEKEPANLQTTLDVAFKDAVNRRIDKAPKIGEGEPRTLDTSAVGALVQFVLDFALAKGAAKGAGAEGGSGGINSARLTIAKLPFNVLDDVCPRLPILQCEEMLSWVEMVHARIGVTNNTVPLRLCNDLLRRLSSEMQPALCGRILMLLAKMFAMDEKSGLNIGGKPHSEGIATPLSEEAFTAELGSATETESAGPPQVDYPLYEAFWGLQPLLVQSSTILSDAKKGPQVLEDLCGRVEKVLAAFEALPLTEHDLVVAGGSGGGGSGDAMDVVAGSSDSRSGGAGGGSGGGEMIGLQYATGARLLRFQLRDPAVRLHVLGQLLILQNAIEAPPRYAPDDATAQAKQLAKVKAANVLAGQARARPRLRPLMRRARRLIEGTRPGAEGGSGASLLALLDTALQRESNWVQLKNAGFRLSYERHGMARDEELGGGRRIAADGGEKPEWAGKRKRLWRMDIKPATLKVEATKYTFDVSQLVAVAQQVRERVPQLEEHLEGFRAAEDPENGCEESEHPGREAKYCWGALRLASQARLTALDGVTSGDAAGVRAIIARLDGTPSLQTLEQASERTMEAQEETAAAAVAATKQP